MFGLQVLLCSFVQLFVVHFVVVIVVADIDVFLVVHSFLLVPRRCHKSQQTDGLQPVVIQAEIRSGRPHTFSTGFDLTYKYTPAQTTLELSSRVTDPLKHENTSQLHILQGLQPSVGVPCYKLLSRESISRCSAFLTSVLLFF